MISKYTEAMCVLRQQEGMSNIEKLFVHCKSHPEVIGIWSSLQVSHRKECWLKMAQANVFYFFPAIEFGPMPNRDWSQPQLRSENVMWLLWCCLAQICKDRIWIPPLQHMGDSWNRSMYPNIIHWWVGCFFINHPCVPPLMEPPILQPSCRDISDSVQRRGAPSDADHCHRRGPTHFPRTWASSIVIEVLLPICSM